ncbi:histone-fold-containing protein [Cladochytrium replicatum]|nr:histone-fold-containing protein [Cladochytrium replicatum]
MMAQPQNHIGQPSAGEHHHYDLNHSLDNVDMGVNSDNSQPSLQNQLLAAFWSNQITNVEHTEPDFKTHALPLARIKKVMKSDEDVKLLMISAEAPIMFAKACEIFIEELTLRAWMHAEENKRRTLQKSDVAMAVSKSDQYDFLIDIVPRELDVAKGPRQTNLEELYQEPWAEYHDNQMPYQHVHAPGNQKPPSPALTQHHAQITHPIRSPSPSNTSPQFSGYQPQYPHNSQVHHRHHNIPPPEQRKDVPGGGGPESQYHREA